MAASYRAACRVAAAALCLALCGCATQKPSSQSDAAANAVTHAPPPSPTPPAVRPGVEREETPDLPVRIGKVTLYRKSRRAEVAASVILTEGILDYLCVLPNSGKEYESLLQLDCRAASLHAALLALGARPGSLDEAFRYKDRGDPRQPTPQQPPGDRVTITLRWGEGEARRSAPVETWLIRRSTGRMPAKLTWVFTGSFFVPHPRRKGKIYLADLERLAVSMLYHGACVLNLAGAAGSPYAGDDKGFEVNPNAVPLPGTPVTVIFHVQKRKQEKKKEP